MTLRSLAVLAGLAALPASAPAALPKPPPEGGPAPLLYILFNGPPGLRVTFYQGAAPPRELRAPVTVGLRPGYVYRVKLSGFPERPGFSLFPTLEVRGTLRLAPDVPPARFPAPVYFSPFDVERLAGGMLLTKVVYLEHPQKAFAEPGRPDQPLEVELPPDRDPLLESRSYGRPVLVVRSGDRYAAEPELRHHSVPGTILFPDERRLDLPARPPQLPWACFQWYDPLVGPRPPEEECLRDGGDTGQPVGFGPEGQLRGLDPEDTVAEYRDAEGRRHLAISNRVCLCVPRFAVLLTALRLDRTQLVLGPAGVRQALREVRIVENYETRRHDQYEQVVATAASQRPSATEGVMATLVVARAEGLEALSVAMLTSDVTGVCREQPRPVDRPLHLCKESDRKSARIGDTVTFTIRYTNRGGRPFTDVVVSDSLTTRLEYVPGSARSSRPAVFTTQANEAGSLVLRWAIAGRLLPGESGTVSFQARVR